MYFKGDISGCLIFLIIVILMLSILKEFWWLIVGLAVIFITFYWGKKIYFLLLNEKEKRNASYNPEMGEVYKICPYCNSKVKVTQTTCPVCKRALN